MVGPICKLLLSVSFLSIFIRLVTRYIFRVISFTYLRYACQNRTLLNPTASVVLLVMFRHDDRITLSFLSLSPHIVLSFFEDVFYVLKNIYLLGYSGSQLWHSEYSSLTRDWTQAPCRGSPES